MFKYGKTQRFYQKYIKWLIDYFKHLITNYLKHTSLHCCHYIVDRAERGIFSIAWAIIILTSVIFCVLLIIIQLKRFGETAIVNTIASTSYPVWKIPFPSVVICNNNVVYRNKAENIKTMLLENGFEEKAINRFFLQLSSLVVCQDCGEFNVVSNDTIDVQIYSYLEELNYDINSLMMELAHPCGKMIKKCYWKSDEKSCGRLFRIIKTTLGYCCAFNYYGTFDVQYEGYERDLKYSGGFGLGSGLQIIVDVEPSEYVSSIKTSPGIEILIGGVYQFAEMGLYSHSLVAGHVLNIGLSPTVHGSHTDLKYISDKSRGCWFHDEGTSRWSRIYNTLTCFNECKAAFIYETCRCVPFYYSFTVGIRKVCTAQDLDCIIDNDTKFAEVMLSNNVDEDMEFIEKHGMSTSKLCYCLPSCEDIQYEIYKNIKEIHYSNSTCMVNIHFNSLTGTYMVRNMHVTWDTLLATIGGIFGLCMGGSILSVVELIFFIINTCLKIKYQRNEQKKFGKQIKRIKFINRTYPIVELKSQFLN